MTPEDDETLAGKREGVRIRSFLALPIAGFLSANGLLICLLAESTAFSSLREKVAYGVFGLGILNLIVSLPVIAAVLARRRRIPPAARRLWWRLLFRAEAAQTARIAAIAFCLAGISFYFLDWYAIPIGIGIAVFVVDVFRPT